MNRPTKLLLGQFFPQVKQAVRLYSGGPVESGTLFVLKDSYGNAIVPFLAAHYNTIIMLDTRTMYYSPTMPAPSELAKEYNAKDFVVIYGVDTVAAGNIDWLR